MGPIGNLEARVAEYPRRGAVAYIASKAKKWDPNGPTGRPPAEDQPPEPGRIGRTRIRMRSRVTTQNKPARSGWD